MRKQQKNKFFICLFLIEIAVETDEMSALVIMKTAEKVQIASFRQNPVHFLVLI